MLSPLDRLVFDRKRMTELFEFDYQLEMYKPVAKRRWGYWAMPILYGDRLVGKLDATADARPACFGSTPCTRTATGARRAAVDREITTWPAGSASRRSGRARDSGGLGLPHSLAGPGDEVGARLGEQVVELGAQPHDPLIGGSTRSAGSSPRSRMLASPRRTAVILLRRRSSRSSSSRAVRPRPQRPAAGRVASRETP